MFTQTILKFTLSAAVLLLSATNNEAAAQKKVIAINSKVQIKATQSEVFDMLKQLKRYPEWSPFLVTDPGQKYTITGTNGEVGSTYSWKGVAEKSKGSQTLASMDGNKFIKMECTILKPFKGNPVFEYYLKEGPEGVEVVQDFKLHLTGFSYFMTKLFGVKKKMVKTNQLGLARLKELVEKESSLTAKTN